MEWETDMDTPEILNIEKPNNEPMRDGIRIKSPTLLCEDFKWSSVIDGKYMGGKAATEPEAWRLAKDAQKFQIAKRAQAKVS